MVPLGVRVSQEMKEILKKAASNNDRSVNQEIVNRLKESMKKRGELSDLLQ